MAVSKLKPASDVLALHTAPSPNTIHHFGENYFQELAEKAAILPATIKWHFIGALQTNKCRPLAETVQNLWCVASVDTIKKADALDKGRAVLLERLKNDGPVAEGADAIPSQDPDTLLRILVQVNTSGEESKSGCSPDKAIQLCSHIRAHCSHLRLHGLMTIGAIARSQSMTTSSENEDFQVLRDTRETVARGLGVDPTSLALSMGMSSDFEGAIAMGSDEVRIGSTIFGERSPRELARVRDDVDT